jgi:hypothetical protein
MVAGAAGTGVGPAPAGAATTPTLTVTPGGPYHSGETINVSVGANRFFRPFGRVNILECADPRGTKANLPTDENTCDGNTIQGNTILVKKDGSFSERGYQLYVLPSVALGETPDARPVCNRKSPCVLYVGEDQGNFTWPKEFSRPFSFSSEPKKSQ